MSKWLNVRTNDDVVYTYNGPIIVGIACSVGFILEAVARFLIIDIYKSGYLMKGTEVTDLDVINFFVIFTILLVVGALAMAAWIHHMRSFIRNYE